jgi:hypothetical protein
MGFYVDFIVKRSGSRQRGVEISYRYNGSSRSLSKDQTNDRGEVRTHWDNVWNGRQVEVFFDGGHKRIITLEPRDSHSVDLPGGCFHGLTPILTPTGQLAIETIRAGDLVMCLPKGGGGLVARPVLRRAVHEPMPLSAVKTRDGRDLLVTANHRLLTPAGYRAVSNLVEGDRLIGVAAHPAGRIVQAIERSALVAPVHNLVVSGHFNFVAGGCVAHCFVQWPALQQWYWTAREQLRIGRVRASSDRGCCRAA